VVSQLKDSVGAEQAKGIAEAVTNGGAPDGNNPQVGIAMANAFVHAFNNIAYVASGVALAGAIICAITVKNSDLHHGAPAAPAD
jgi:hypothetical protein